MITNSDVLAGVQAWWAQMGLVATVPGGLNVDPVLTPDKTYAKVKITEEKPDINGGLASYIQKYHLKVSVWSEEGAADSGSIRKAIETAFSIRNQAQLAVPGARVLHVNPEQGEQDVDSATRQGNFVQIASVQREIMLQGSL